MALINPHINFNGNAEEAFGFYQSVFGGEFTQVVRFGDLPGDGFPVAAHEANKLMNIALPIGPNILIGNDVPESMGPTNERENRSKISVRAESLEEAEQLFKGLSDGGEVEVPFSNDAQVRFGMFRDKFGIEWIIVFDLKMI